MDTSNVQRYIQMAQDWAVQFAPKILLAVVIFWIGLKIITKLNAITTKTLAARKVDSTIRPFFASFVDLGLKLILFLIVANIFGFETTSFVAIISALAFAVGLALQGSLGHFASGILLLVLKPYRVGDKVLIADQEGFVEEIQIFNTIIRTEDNRLVIIPNGMVTSGLICNLSGQGNRRVDMTFVVDEPNNVDRVKKVIQEAVESCPYVLNDPPTNIFLLEFDCDELRFAARPWCRSEHYWAVWAHVQEAVKFGFDKADLTGNVQYVQLIQERKDITQ